MARAQRKLEGFVAILARIEFRAVGEPARVVHGNRLPGAGFGTFADNDFFDDKAAGRGGLTHGVAPGCGLMNAAIMPERLAASRP